MQLLKPILDIVIPLLDGLGVDKTIFATMGIFVVAYWAAHFTFLKRLTDFLVERDERTQGRSDNVDEFNEELATLSEELTQKKNEVSKEADAIFNEIKDKALAQQSEAIKTAKEKASAEVAAARAAVEKEFEAEAEKVKAEVPALAAAIIDRLMTAQKKTKSSADDSVRTGV